MEIILPREGLMQFKTTPLSLRCCSSSEEWLTLLVLCKETPLRAGENCHRKSYFVEKCISENSWGEMHTTVLQNFISHD